MSYKDPPKEHRFKKGQSGNPKGMKPGTLNFKTILTKILETEIDQTNELTGKNEKRTIADHIGIKHAKQALEGDVQSTNLILDRLEGKPLARTETKEVDKWEDLI